MKVVVAGAAFVAFMASLFLPSRKTADRADKAVAVQFSNRFPSRLPWR
jgi:hypothetical protein